MSQATDNDKQQIQRLVPQFLYLWCAHCKKFRKFTELKVEIVTDTKRGRIGTVVGNCGKCGRESRESIQDEVERAKMARRTIRFVERANKRQLTQKEQNPTMALKVGKKSKKTEKVTSATKNRKVEKATPAKASKKTAAASAERESHWERKEGQPNGTATLAMIFAGGAYTIEEAQKRHDQMAKKGLIAKRTKPLGTIDGTWLTKRPNGVNVNGTKHEAYRGLNEDGEDVFSVPTLADPLVPGSKAVKTKESNGKLMLGKIVLVKDVKELKGEKPSKKAAAPAKAAKPAKAEKTAKKSKK
jgi:hypothetical protein